MIVNGKEIFKFKTDNKCVNILSQFCLGRISNRSGTTELSLKEYVYDFSVDYTVIKKSDILNSHKYLMEKNNIKQCWGLSNKCLFYY